MIEQHIEDQYEKITELEYRLMFPDDEPTPGADMSLSVSGYIPKNYGNITLMSSPGKALNVTTPGLSLAFSKFYVKHIYEVAPPANFLNFGPSLFEHQIDPI